jgi:hypothetical protein
MSPLGSPIEEASRIVGAANEKGVVLRLFGGVAFWYRCPSAKHGSLQRNYVDIDLMGHAKQSREIKQLFVALGYTPRDKFNAIQGYRRLIFNDMENQRRVDIFLDVFEMCHSFNFKDKLELDDKTIALTDLLITKLQVVDTNRKDLNDMVTLFADYEVGKDDNRSINGSYLAKLCASDWGVYKTFTMNLGKLLSQVKETGLEDATKQVVSTRLNQLNEIIENAPKDFKWKMRARVGEKVKWYDQPEADKEVVDSRIITDQPTAEKKPV